MPNAASHGKHTVVYIMGTGRSGSTLLEILLSHGEGVFGGGELFEFYKDWADKSICSCGKGIFACEVWNKVIHSLGFSDLELKKIISLNRKVEWHSGLIKQVVGLIKPNDYAIYSKFNEALLRSVLDASESGVVIDSSKYPGRALALSKSPNVDLKVIYLTRSPEGLLKTFQKPNKSEQPPKKAFAVLKYYIYVTLSCWVVSRIIKGDVFHLRYEDLVRDPIKVMGEIEQWSGINYDKCKKKLAGHELFNVGHLLTGNRMRKQGAIKVDPQNVRPHLVGVWQRLVLFLMLIWKRLLGI